MNEKIPYICGPIRELDEQSRKEVFNFYEKIAEMCKDTLNVMPFVPHLHFNPNNDFSPQEIDKVERDRVCNKTSVLIVVAVAPSWGGGIEIEMSYRSNVPVIILRPNGKDLSRLMRGNPAIKSIIDYNNQEDAINKLKDWMRLEFNKL